MFSELIESLRTEAQKASAANQAMLAATYQEKMSFPEKTEVLGATMAMGGMTGLIGFAMANAAAGSMAAGIPLGAMSTALAGASAPLMALGSVAVAGGALPIVTVATLGAAVAGVVVMGIGKLMPEGRSQEANTNLGIGDWLQGAKRLVMSTLNGPALETKQIGDRAGRDAAFNYELEELFGSAAETKLGQQSIVEDIGVDIWDGLGAVVDDAQVHACLGRSQPDGVVIGKILDVDTARGLVVQSIGRGKAVVHNLSDFPKMPIVGHDVSIGYKGGKMLTERVQSHDRGLGR